MRNCYLLFLISFVSINLFADIKLASPQIKLNSQNQRVIEIKIENITVTDGDITLDQYKSNDPINEKDIIYTLIKNFDTYQSFTIVLSEEYQEDYFSFKLKIKKTFEKDIFIFLPSKMRNYSQNQPLTKNSAKDTRVDLKQTVIKVPESKIRNEESNIFKAKEITTMWSMAKKVKSTSSDLSIYQIMWSIYLGNKDAFINDNINLIRKDVDISIPSEYEMQKISDQSARDSIFKMNDTFLNGFSSATKTLLVLTAPSVIENTNNIIEKTINDKNKDLSLNTKFSPEDFIEKNTKEIQLGIENELVDEFLEKFEESEKQVQENNFKVIDLVFISLISLISGILLALIYIYLKNIKASRNNIDYDFEEAEEDNSDNIMPDGLSVENNKDQQQYDLAVMYFEMDDKKSAQNILNNIIIDCDDELIKESALSLLKKIK
tara:strand:- start:16061 stop:17362 length:1302 start_codon:yes stop_codon:yes gene_type:complete